MTDIAPAISVVIPLYNAENYIGACLESILGQTFQILKLSWLMIVQQIKAQKLLRVTFKNLAEG